jgi:enoyl-CoA hydratase/carnithine racemase
VHFTLKRAVGLAVAAELLLTGRTLTGRVAADRGIATTSMPAAEVLPAAIALAREVAIEANPLSVALSKRLLWADLDADQAGAEETRAHRILLGGPDAAEGAAAWRERRSPRWQSRASEVGDGCEHR